MVGARHMKPIGLAAVLPAFAHCKSELFVSAPGVGGWEAVSGSYCWRGCVKWICPLLESLVSQKGTKCILLYRHCCCRLSRLLMS